MMEKETGEKRNKGERERKRNREALCLFQFPAVQELITELREREMVLTQTGPNHTTHECSVSAAAR